MTVGRVQARPHCVCTTVQNYDYAQAAEKLACHPRWLQDNISSLPHQKRGEKVSFCPCELVLIQRMTTRLPTSVLELLTPTSAPESAAPAVARLSAIRPSRGRARATAGV